MAGISLLRPQYSNLGSVAMRLASGARQVAHETDESSIARLSEGHASGVQEESALQDVVIPTFDQRRDPDKKDSREGGHAVPASSASAPAASEAGPEFRVDPHEPASERMTQTGLVVAQPLPLPERLRAAEQAYGATRKILQSALAKPGNGFDAAS